MITKFIINGTVSEKYEYTAIFCANDLSRETCFYDQNSRDDSYLVRFFSKGNEIILRKTGVSHSGSGGSFCEYMFGMNIPFADLIRPNSLNRLIIWGAYNNEGRSLISFTSKTDGFETYENIFKHGNAVSNWFFFVTSRIEIDMLKDRKSVV